MELFIPRTNARHGLEVLFDRCRQKVGKNVGFDLPTCLVVECRHVGYSLGVGRYRLDYFR